MEIAMIEGIRGSAPTKLHRLDQRLGFAAKLKHTSETVYNPRTTNRNYTMTPLAKRPREMMIFFDDFQRNRRVAHLKNLDERGRQVTHGARTVTAANRVTNTIGEHTSPALRGLDGFG